MPPPKRTGNVGDAGRAEVLLEIEVAVERQLETRGIEQRAENGQQRHDRDGWRCLEDRPGIGIKHERGIENLQKTARLEGTEQEAGILGLFQTHAREIEDRVEAGEGERQDHWQEHFPAEPMCSHRNAAADQDPGQPEQQRSGCKQRGQIPHGDAGAESEADRTHEQQEAGGSEKPADHRIGNEACEEAKPQHAEAPGQYAREGRGQRDQNGDGGHQAVFLIGRPGLGHGADGHGKHDRRHVLRLADGPTKAVEEAADAAHQRRTQERQPETCLEQRCQGPAINDGGEGNDEGDGERGREKRCPDSAQDGFHHFRNVSRFSCRFRHL